MGAGAGFWLFVAVISFIVTIVGGKGGVPFLMIVGGLMFVLSIWTFLKRLGRGL